ncbi:MAG: redoxin domain-containing protein [Pirellulales bacterium]|nr:redoxin domain-containing protein [Pirellulales bacterium]
MPIFASGAAPSVEQALKLAPIQKDVDYAVPAATDTAKCTIKAEKLSGQTGWVVRNPNGEVLREFVDTDGDNVVDRWSYFKDGIEVYRDIDENHNGKADQYRWLNTAGIRWGIDKDEDGKIDSWKAISAEEVSAEIVFSLRDKDVARFQRVLLSPADVKALGLGDDKAKEISERMAVAPKDFQELLRRMSGVNEKTTFVHFGATKPGVVPAGSFGGSTNDVVAYENVVAMIETGGKDGQVQVGTIVKVGDQWRVIAAPATSDAKGSIADARGFFFSSPYRGPNAAQGEGADEISEQLQATMTQLSKLEEAISRATSEAQLAELNEQRADLLQKIADSIGEKDRPQWIRQLADTMSAAAQMGTYPNGVDRLKSLLEKLEKNPDDAAQVPYVKYRHLLADFGIKAQKPGVDWAKLQGEWLENLKQFAKDFPNTPDTAEVLLQLGIAEESSNEDQAKKWYGQLISSFPATASANKARGAVNRLNSVGEKIELHGKTIHGQYEDLAKYKGKYVLIHYWATWSEPCKVDLAQLKELHARYAKSGLALIGVSVDANAADLNDYLAKNRLPWPQLWEPGGQDGRFAIEMGIFTMPTMILVDDKGKVVNRNIHITEVDGELKSRLK